MKCRKTEMFKFLNTKLYWKNSFKINRPANPLHNNATKKCNGKIGYKICGKETLMYL